MTDNERVVISAENRTPDYEVDFSDLLHTTHELIAEWRMTRGADDEGMDDTAAMQRMYVGGVQIDVTSSRAHQVRISDYTGVYDVDFSRPDVLLSRTTNGVEGKDVAPVQADFRGIMHLRTIATLLVRAKIEGMEQE